MKYIISERQYKLLVKEQEEEILYIPSVELFGNWNTLQKFLERKGNPLYSIGGDLDLRNSDIKSLGNLTSVDGYLDLGYSKIKSLGNLTSVGEDLDLSNSKIESLGNLTSVGGNLNLRNSDIKSFGNLTSVGRNLYLYGTPLYKEIRQKKYSEKEIRQMVNVGGNIF